MESSLIAGLVCAVLLIAGNIIGFTYAYGKLSQKVEDTQRRLERIEHILNHGRDS